MKEGRGYKVPNGALFSTVGDMAAFNSFEMGFGPPTVLKPSTLRDNFRRSFAWGQHPGWQYGVGFFTMTQDGRTIVGHSGNVEGYVAHAFFNPTHRVGFVLLRNALPAATMDGSMELVLKSLSILAGR